MINVGNVTFNEKSINNTQLVEGRTRRECIEITLVDTTYADVSAAFVNGVVITQQINARFGIRSVANYSEYSILKDVIIKPNGNIIVYMAKKTEIETYSERIAALEEENAALLFENLTGEEFSE